MKLTSEGTERRYFRLITKFCNILLVFGIVSPVCQSAPSFNPRSIWHDDNNVPSTNILEPGCDPTTGRCWGWLPIVDSTLDDYVEDMEYNRVQQIHTRNVDRIPAYDVDTEAKSLMPVSSDKMANRLSKKDVFTSRGWGAGGMPFSVLYMSPRANHQQASESNKNDESLRKNHNEPISAASSSPTTAKTSQPNYRVALRNGNSNQQPRRHYSIIPQLFISYGWGPSGK